MLDFIRDNIFGKQENEVLIIIILEWILTAYGIGMTVTSKRLWSKILNIVLTILWVVCAILNMIAFFF